MIQERMPRIMARRAPTLLALDQYNPITNGTNMETRLRIEDSLTNS
jgi:hypothetical protein